LLTGLVVLVRHLLQFASMMQGQEVVQSRGDRFAGGGGAPGVVAHELPSARLFRQERATGFEPATSSLGKATEQLAERPKSSAFPVVYTLSGLLASSCEPERKQAEN